MLFEVFTLLPEVFAPYLESSILLRARERGILDVRLHNIRDFTHDKHHTTDDVPYGGGGGMVMKPEPVFEAIGTVLGGDRAEPATCPIILLTPQGRVFTQSLAQEWSRLNRIALICGRYEGVDERIRRLATDEISIGDYVLTGGELAALVVMDAVLRLLPGAIDEASTAEESFAEGLLEYPQYTRPATFEGVTVPPTLVSGHHEEVRKWRLRESLRRTQDRRPDLLVGRVLTTEERRMLDGLREVSAEAAEGDDD